MNVPILIHENSFQKTWISIIKLLSESNWESWNLIAHITNPNTINIDLHKQVELFTINNSLKKPKTVAFTIFPYPFYQGFGTSEKLYDRYQRYYKSIKSKVNWGLYFNRMINYNNDNSINQLKNIINAINDRERVSKAAYTIVIEKPGYETTRPLGAPCLNYIAVQIDSTVKEISLLCVYRNHDFLERAYGNYWGLCKLLEFITIETKYKIGTLTCISSHAFINSRKKEIKSFINEVEKYEL